MATNPKASALASLLKWHMLFPRPDTTDKAELTKYKIMTLVKCSVVSRLTAEDGEPCAVEAVPGLFIGSIGTVVNRRGLKEHGITHILCAAGGIRSLYEEDFKYHVVDVKDAPGEAMTPYFDECTAFIDAALKAGGRCLVHCFAGKSRSTTMLVAYLMKTRGMNLSAALKMIRKTRPIAQPNAGFAAQLLTYQRALGISPTDSDAKEVELASETLPGADPESAAEREAMAKMRSSGDGASAAATRADGSAGGAGGGAGTGAAAAAASGAGR